MAVLLPAAPKRGRSGAAVDRAGHELGLISEVLVLLEREQFQAPLLISLRGSLAAEGAPPSRRLAQLKRLIEYLDSRDNVFVRMAEIFIFWTPHLAARVEEWRRRSDGGAPMAGGGGEIEALASLASHAFEHPQDPFPSSPKNRRCSKPSRSAIR